ncbi:MAG TPA: TerC family protein [Vicinamibacteria bacterium]|nr:TerC family protein [Vicinamibacteria bacterium]
MLDAFTTPEAWISLATLTALEIVLGIDNIVFITLLAGKLPPSQRHAATRFGLAGALVTRLLLLLTLRWVMKLSTPLWTVLDHPVTGRDLVLILGGLFLVAKATIEIYEKVEAAHPLGKSQVGGGKGRMLSIVLQIMLLDIVFSLDSVITAVGMVSQIEIMVVAVVIAIVVMLVFAAPIGDFVERHPSIKILALSFLVMIGVLLVAEGTGQHFNRGYVYFAMLFSLTIELLNMRYRSRHMER